MRVIVILIVIGALSRVPKSLKKGLKELEIGRRIETVQTWVLLRSARILRKNPRDLRRLAVFRTPVKNHHLTLVWKTHKEQMIIITIIIRVMFIHRQRWIALNQDNLRKLTEICLLWWKLAESQPHMLDEFITEKWCTTTSQMFRKRLFRFWNFFSSPRLVVLPKLESTSITQVFFFLPSWLGLWKTPTV